jgi:hypothetical protein
MLPTSSTLRGSLKRIPSSVLGVSSGATIHGEHARARIDRMKHEEPGVARSWPP